MLSNFSDMAFRLSSRLFYGFVLSVRLVYGKEVDEDVIRRYQYLLLYRYGMHVCMYICT